MIFLLVFGMFDDTRPGNTISGWRWSGHTYVRSPNVRSADRPGLQVVHLGHAIRLAGLGEKRRKNPQQMDRILKDHGKTWQNPYFIYFRMITYLYMYTYVWILYHVILDIINILRSKWIDSTCPTGWARDIWYSLLTKWDEPPTRNASLRIPN